MSKGIAPRDAFGDILIEIGRRNPKVVVLNADLASPARVEKFAKEFPERYIQVGIAEQNMIGIAAGLASVGYIPIATTFAMLASRRACDQVSISVAYPKLNVKIVGCYVGLLVGKLGATHQCVHDLAIMRSIPNMVVLSPSDAKETKEAVKAAIEYNGPCYIRIERDSMPSIFGEDYKYELGKGVTIREGKDISIIATGVMTPKAVEASKILSKKGIEARIINIHTIKPIDEEIIIKAAKETRGIVTCENHSIIGGLGSAVSEIISEEFPVLLKRIGIQDMFGESGANEDLFRKYGMTEDIIVRSAMEIYRKR